MQTELFETGQLKNGTTGLIISKSQKNILSKQQQVFNKLVKKIERLRIELDQISKTLNEKLDYYGKHIFPLEQQLIELKKELVLLLFSFFENKKLLSKKDRHSLGRVICVQLVAIFQSQTGEPDDKLKKIFKSVEGISYEEAAEEDFDMMKDEMESMFEEFGFDLDLDELHRKMTQEDMIKKAMEWEEQIKQQADEKDQNQANRKKTKKQLEKEEREKQVEEARAKNIAGIYRQLAKILHPDLEQDAELKLQKEELMKQLTIAYEKNDLHTLLTMELAWIQKEENNPGQLTDNKLDIYNEVLKEQVFELEQEMHNTLQHPRYLPLQKYAIFSGVQSINLSHEKKQVEEMTNAMLIDISKLKGNEKQALGTVKEIIRAFEIQINDEIDFSRFL